jgi:hypothetical protein
VDVFDSNFQQVQLAGSFTDPDIPDGFAPFGIRNINGTIFVTYAKQNDTKHDDVAGPGNGFIDEFDTDGNFLGRFASEGALNSPHGLALAPADFGEFSNALLVGNFGDGRINAFDPATGQLLGQLDDANSQPITNVGIWGITFGNGAGDTKTNSLYFAAGINGEEDGLLGSISLAKSGHRQRSAASPAAVALDQVFARLDQAANQLPNAGQGQQLEPRQDPAGVSIPETMTSASNQVGTSETKAHLPMDAGNETVISLGEMVDAGPLR